MLDHLPTDIHEQYTNINSLYTRINEYEPVGASKWRKTRFCSDSVFRGACCCESLPTRVLIAACCLLAVVSKVAKYFASKK